MRADVLIERVITKDSFDGSPWPPEDDGWRMVRELDDWRHEWRRISLSSGLGCQTAPSAALWLPKGISATVKTSVGFRAHRPKKRNAAGIGRRASTQTR